MTFTPRFLDNSYFGQSLGKIVCVGRNYAEHAKELDNPVPTEPLSSATPEQAERAVIGLGLALDLTLRDVQSQLKGKGHPWEVAKSFDGACPLSAFVKLSDVPDWGSLSFSLSINDELRQVGKTADMLFSVPQLLVEMSRHFTLEPGDVILTGTPAGVGVLPRGAKLHFSLDDAFEVTTQVAS